MNGVTDVRGLLTMAGAALLFAGAAGAADEGTKMKKAPDDKALIASAMSAAPPTIAKNATIVAPGADGKLRVLREGSNSFTCFPDDPKTPGPDPLCADRNALEHMLAAMERKIPPPGKVGFIYALAGGVDASNTDPYATKPEAGGQWIRTGPHVKVTGADQSFYDQYPKGAAPDTAVPYVMWAGTPYQHLMAPVR